MPSPRGQIDAGALARAPAVHRIDLPCVHHPRSSDVLLNQVLGAGLRFASAMTSAPPLRSAAREHAAQVAEVAKPCRLDRSTIEAAQHAVDRLTHHYAPALTLIRLLYENTSLSLEDGRDVVVPGCLFDMNRFFQALVTRLLREHLEGFAVAPEFTLREMMAFDPARNPQGRRSPRPRPDLAVLKGSKLVQLLDAKYRDLWKDPLPRDMLYQLAVYALSQRDARTAAILYPTVAEDARTARIEIRDPLSSASRAGVELRPLIVPRLVRLLDAGETNSRLRELARGLALGHERSATATAVA